MGRENSLVIISPHNFFRYKSIRESKYYNDKVVVKDYVSQEMFIEYDELDNHYSELCWATWVRNRTGRYGADTFLDLKQLWRQGIISIWLDRLP